ENRKCRQRTEKDEIDELPDNEQRRDVETCNLAKLQRREVQKRPVPKKEHRTQREQSQANPGHASVITQRDSDDGIATHLEPRCRDQKSQSLKYADGTHHRTLTVPKHR